MAGLVTIADLETALGYDIETADEPRMQWYIDVISEFIETYTDQSFTPVSNQAVICETDRRGAIEFPTLNAVSKVEFRDPWLGTYTETTSGNYAFDGVSTIYALEPYATYRVTVSYGWTTVPTDIKGVVVDLILIGANLSDGAQTGLKSKRVGDHEEFYGLMPFEAGGPIITLSAIQRDVLDSYRYTTRTWRM